ncbi:MAG: hypothetical protein ACK41C_14695 [Phenylobacterium sp.]|uniref:hypothetical protein n=1 Tax=Phenylobacterium sp. TaxID=1871053 RepID=UPI00391D2A77
MRVFVVALVAAAVGLGGCVSSPKQTVLNLDTTDRKWTSSRCVAARKAVARYDDQEATRGVVGFVGNLMAPLAGTAASLAMSAARDDERAALNRRVRVACISDPLNEKQAKKTRKRAYAQR